MIWLAQQSGILKNVSNNVVINLFINYGVIVGCVGGICLFGSLPLFYFHYKMSAVDYQKNIAVTFLPWCGKAIVGAISDTYPIAGWHKRWLLVAASVGLCGGMLGVGMSTAPGDALGWLFVASVCIMINSTLWEGQYANNIRFLKADPRGISFAWGGYMLGTAGGAVIVSTMAGMIQNAYFMGAAMAVTPLPFLLLLPDITLQGDRENTLIDQGLLSNVEPSKNDLRGKRASSVEWALAWGIALLSVVLIVVIETLRGYVVTPFLVVVGTGIGATMAVLRVMKGNTTLAALCIMSMAHHIFWVDITGALDAFYTADEECFLGGPGFDLNFYLGVVQIIGSAVGLGAAAFYAFVVAGFDTRTALLGAVTFRIATGIFDLVIVQRWNRVYLGVDDKAFFVMGDAVASSAAGMLAMLPIKTLASRVIAGGGTTTEYAFVDSYMFLGQGLSRVLGMGLMTSLGVRADARGGCDFTMLPILIAIAHCVMPILSLTTAWAIVPRAIIKREN